MNTVRYFILVMVTSLTLCPAICSAEQVDDVLIEDGFEGTLGNWTATNGSSLWTWPGSGINYASIESGAARIPRQPSGVAVLILSEPLPLDQNEYTNVTIRFDYVCEVVSSTVRWDVEYSSDGGTNWTSLVTISATTNRMQYSKTLNEGPTYPFTDTAFFRIRGWNQTPTVNLYADEMKIIGFPKPPPQGTVVILY